MITLEAFYRPDNYPEWVPWRTFSQQFDVVGRIGALTFGGVPSAREGFAPRISFGKPSNACDPTTKRRLRRGYTFQVRLHGVGHATIDQFRLHAQRLTEKSTATC